MSEPLPFFALVVLANHALANTKLPRSSLRLIRSCAPPRRVSYLTS